MGFFDEVKNFMGISSDEFEDEDIQEQDTSVEENDNYYEEAPKKKPAKIIKDDRRTKNSAAAAQPQMQVVLVRPEQFDEVTAIADHLNARKSVILNLEAANRETSRRIIDFLSGVAYANRGSIKKVASSTFMIAPNAVDISGELLLDDFGDGQLYDNY